MLVPVNGREKGSPQSHLVTCQKQADKPNRALVDLSYSSKHCGMSLGEANEGGLNWVGGAEQIVAGLG